jgi:hypothetical protein
LNKKGRDLLIWAGWNLEVIGNHKSGKFEYWWTPDGEEHLRLGVEPKLQSLDLLISIIEAKCKKYSLLNLNGKYAVILGENRKDKPKYETSLIVAIQKALLKLMQQ